MPEIFANRILIVDDDKEKRKCFRGCKKIWYRQELPPKAN